MKEYFNIRYEFNRERVHRAISERVDYPGSDYICVADGVILHHANYRRDYHEAINGGMFSICDSSYVPLYIRLIHGHRVTQYTGSEIFEDIVRSRKYRMMFLGTRTEILEGLRRNITEWNPEVAEMKFVELPFCEVSEFDYESISAMIHEDKADIIWIALGAPKQEYFMQRLKPHLNRGVMIAVGAAFKFYSGVSVKRAPKWMVKSHLEFLQRLVKEPKKQFGRCVGIIKSLPHILRKEWRKKRGAMDELEQIFNPECFYGSK